VDSIDNDDLDLSPLRVLQIDWHFYPITTELELDERIHHAELVVSNKVRLDRESLKKASSLQLLCVAATGTNNVDLEAAQDLDIAVANVSGYATSSVIQHVYALITALSTHLLDFQTLVAAGRWQQSKHFCVLDYPINELAGKTLGIVGYGELGAAVGRVAEAFDMRVLLSQRPGGRVKPGRIPLHDLLPQLDVLSLHCPLTANTRNLIGTRELEMMKSSALLINTARAGIVDETALATALKAGMIGGAGIDVLSTEPPERGNPLLEPGIPNLIVTPHIAWASRESRQRLIDEVAHNIEAFMHGHARNRVV
jgi:glycerate dehydrogenase